MRAEAWSALLAFKTTALTGILVSLARSRLDSFYGSGGFQRLKNYLLVAVNSSRTPRLL